MADITAIILTYNEEKNISLCISSIADIVERIVVIDCGSKDRTVELARSLGAEVLFHKWENYSKQYSWGVENADIKTKWIFRIDADEQLTEDSSKELDIACRENQETDVNGIVVRFKVNFLGKDLKHGGIYPFKKLLVYKAGKGFIEGSNMDEHIILKDGKCIELKNDSIHHDFKNLSLWTEKHNKYSTREVMDYFERKETSLSLKGLSRTAKIRRFFKHKIYYRLPIGVRSHLYYLYRYYVKLGFLDGKEGKIFAFLQAYWYRFLVDAKIFEEEKALREKR